MPNSLLKLSLVISILGIFFLLILTNLSQVSVQGRVVYLKSYDDFKIITLDTNKTLTCDSCFLKPNQTIQVQGKLITYQGKEEIQANKIRILGN